MFETYGTLVATHNEKKVILSFIPKKSIQHCSGRSYLQMYQNDVFIQSQKKFIIVGKITKKSPSTKKLDVLY